MDINIVINSKVYLTYKDEILPLSARLFCDSYFYDIKNYKDPIDLKGIENYLKFTDNVNLYTTSSFLDFVNILLVLSFLKSKNYDCNINIFYHNINEKSFDKSIIMKVNLKLNDLCNVDEILNNIKDSKEITNSNLKLPGIINYINFYNLLTNTDKFLLCFEEVIDSFDEDIELIANYLYQKYSNMGLDKQYYLSYLKKIM